MREGKEFPLCYCAFFLSILIISRINSIGKTWLIDKLRKKKKKKVRGKKGKKKWGRREKWCKPFVFFWEMKLWRKGGSEISHRKTGYLIGLFQRLVN